MKMLRKKIQTFPNDNQLGGCSFLRLLKSLSKNACNEHGSK
jgi:hypothetical protein